VKPDTMLRAAWIWLAVALVACASASGHASSAAGELAGRVLAGLVQALFAGAAVAVVVVMLGCRRFRLLAGVAGAEARHGASRRLDLAGGRAGGLHVCKRPRLVRRRGAGRPGAVITVGSFDFPKVSCSPRSTARRSPWQGSRYGSCRSWAPASWSIRR